jgi:predicted ATPase
MCTRRNSLVGENGTGESTLLEAIAWSVGFGEREVKGSRETQRVKNMIWRICRHLLTIFRRATLVFGPAEDPVAFRNYST